MDKVYLKYYNDKEYRNPVQCDFGPAWAILWQGGFYAYKKNDINRALIILILHVCVITLSLLIAPLSIGLMIGLIFALFINFLFALNYNMIVIEGFIRAGYLPMDSVSSEKLIQKGIYFKLQ